MKMCRTASTGYFVFLCSFCLVGIQIACGLTSITCTSVGDINSTCHRSAACYEEHSIPAQLAECDNKQLSHMNKTVAFSGYNITECSRGHIGFHRCNAVDEPFQPYLVQSLSYTLLPLDARYFSMDVSWTWFDEDFQSALGQLVGYELRIVSDSPRPQTTVKCLCIWEPFLRNISLGFDPVLYYRASSFNTEAMKVALYTLPYEEKWQYVQYSVSKDTSWPIACQRYDIAANVRLFCPVPLPGAPTGVNVLSRLSVNAMKGLDVSWISGHVAPTSSETYYATVFDSLWNISLRFVVTGSRNIQISGLYAGTNYSVMIRGYSLCSGLPSFDSNYSRDVGCGALSEAIEEVFQLPSTPSLVSTNSTGYTSSRNNRVIFIACTIVMATLFLTFGLLFLSILLYQYIFPCRKRHSQEIGMDPNPFQLANSLSTLDALVLYSHGSPILERIVIEQYVVCLLRRSRLVVLSCNDHTEKTAMQWVEENARSAHAVFVVCNEHLCKEWRKQCRTPLINSLDMIIASAVGQMSIRKYATVLLKPSDEQFIPDNLYLKGMRRFVLGAEATTSNRSEFISFIKMQHLLRK